MLFRSVHVPPDLMVGCWQDRGGVDAVDRRSWVRAGMLGSFFRRSRLLDITCTLYIYRNQAQERGTRVVFFHQEFGFFTFRLVRCPPHMQEQRGKESQSRTDQHKRRTKPKKRLDGRTKENGRNRPEETLVLLLLGIDNCFSHY